jgi:hypothetical protein
MSGTWSICKNNVPSGMNIDYVQGPNFDDMFFFLFILWDALKYIKHEDKLLVTEM